MYGMVNGAIKALIVKKYGNETWEKVRAQAQIESADFMSMEQYDDSISVDLVVALSTVLSKSPAKVLEEVGEFWIEFAHNSEYGALLDMAGDTLPQILMNLDDMHTRVGQSFSALRPPSFWCTDVTDQSLTLHYSSERDGLSPMIIGLVKGLGRLLDIECEITQVSEKDATQPYASFSVTFMPHAQREKTSSEASNVTSA